MSTLENFLKTIRQFLSNYPKANDLILLVGLIYISILLLKFLYKFSYGFKVYIFSKFVSKNAWLRSQGNWGAITGCTHGIGLAYAKELAKRNINLILIARNKTLLEKMAEAFENKYKIKTMQVVADLNEHDWHERVEKALLSKDIGILINNAGVNPEVQLSHLMPSESFERVINVNLRSLTLITRMILPQMVKKNKGIIVNVASSIILFPGNCYAAYSASKAYVIKFTEALQAEYRNTGITIQCIKPGFVQTAMNASTVGSLSRLTDTDAIKYSSVAVRTLGYTNNTYGHWSHGFQGFFISLLPEWLFKSLVAYGIEKLYYKTQADRVKSTSHYAFDDFELILNSD